MTLRHRVERLFGPEDVRPLNERFKVLGVFNPGAVVVGDEVVLLVRVAETPSDERPGFVGLPRYDASGDAVVDWTPVAELDCTDPRVVRRESDGRVRLTSISHLRVLRRPARGDPAWRVGPVFLPASPIEEYGVEDPRITEIDGRYWITYVAVSRHGAATALASTLDFITFERHGVIFPPENKDVVLFPRKIDGKYVALNRPTAKTNFCRPEIWLSRSPDLLHWGEHQPLLSGLIDWEAERIGAGPPPIELSSGWLVIYHGCGVSDQCVGVGEYCAGAVVLDLFDPRKVLRRSSTPVLRPIADFEREGVVPNVVFPTALIESEATLKVFYGAADTAVGVVEFPLSLLLGSLCER
ncbi:glycoside hydrolase family 130 protein [Botrimarina mediterranea]|uniref:glycoside hydrolase family 130 protein n=1 Tax=Botrimarina mediterranea TaxID=2528022 RepID=UPI0011A8D8CC|nr:glycoside hydrolase family 130 protein [Botrimarina mediterranea]